MSNATLSTFAQIALEQWQPDLVHLTLKQHPLLDKIKNDNVLNPKYGSFLDDKYIVGAQTQYAMAARGTGEGATLPSSTIPKYVKMTAELKTIKARQTISWETLNTSENNKAFIENTVTNLQNSVRKGLSHTLNSAVYGYSSNGAIGTVGSGSSGTSVVCRINPLAATTPGSTPGNIYIAAGMPIVIAPSTDFVGASWDTTYAATTVNQRGNDLTTFTIADSYGACYNTGDLIVPGEYVSGATNNGYTTLSAASPTNGRLDQYMWGFNGLWDHVNTTGTGGGSTYQGVTRASYPLLQGTVARNGGTTRALTEAMVQQAMYTSALKTQDSLARPDLIITTFYLQMAWETLFHGYRKYDTNIPTTTPEGGYIDARIGGITPLNDPFCCGGQMWFLNTKSFTFIYSTNGGGGIDRFCEYERWNGNQMFFPAGTNGDKDLYEMRVRARCQLVCENPPQNLVLGDLEDQASY